MSVAQMFFTVLSGVLWLIVYVEAIRLGLRQKTYAMPFWALALNLTWEGLYTGLRFHGGQVGVADYVNALWFLFDLGLLYTYLRFGRRTFPAGLQRWFWGWTLAGLAAAASLQWLFWRTFGFGQAVVYSAFLQNLVMSLLFIQMWVGRGGNLGQSCRIAAAKGLGTLAATINFGFLGLIAGVETFVLVVGGWIAFFDAVYFVLVWTTPPHRAAARAEAG